MTKPKLLLDEDVHVPLAAALRRDGYNAVHIKERALDRLPDSQVLASAVQEERVVLTFNREDFLRLYNEYFQQHFEHWGIIIAKQYPLKTLRRRLLDLLQPLDAHDLHNQVKFL